MFYKLIKSLVLPLSVILIAMIVGLVLTRRANAEKRRRFRAGRILLIAAAALLYLLSIPPVADLLVRPLESGYPRSDAAALQGVQAVVVLTGGAGQANALRPEAAPGGVSLARIIHGVEVFRASGAQHLVITGAAPDQAVSEAATMKAVAIKMGVPTDKIVLEEKATSTAEHAPRVLEAMPELAGMKIALVTSALHMPRSVGAFRKHFRSEQLVPCPSDWLYNSEPWTLRTFAPSADSLAKSTNACVEYIGRLWYWLRG
ncbi:MAG: YdcF family protein [Planctomycetaceae bacterium]|nr:YdcF family protein [Planctomycetaceae bacterium]